VVVFSKSESRSKGDTANTTDPTKVVAICGPRDLTIEASKSKSLMGYGCPTLVNVD